MCDMADDRREKMPRRPWRYRRLEGGMADAGADPQRRVGDVDLLQRGDEVDVDEMRRSRDAIGHHRGEALAAGEDAPVRRREFAEHRYGLVEARRPMVDEGRRLHGAGLPPASSAARRS